MRCTSLVMCDPANADQAASLQKVVDAYLKKHPDAKLTWLQSAATRQVWDNTHHLYVMHANHLLTCAIEYESINTRNTTTPMEPTSPPKKRR